MTTHSTDDRDQTAPSTADLISRLTEQTAHLVRDEVALAKLEIAEKAKRMGVGAGLLSAAGVLAWFGLGTLIATAVLGLAEAMPAWLAALLVAVVVLALAGIVALVGRRSVRRAAPPVPQEAIQSLKLDVAEVRRARHRGH